MQMNRIDDMIANPEYYYDDKAIDGFIEFCEEEMTLTDGADLKLLDTFKLWRRIFLHGFGLKSSRFLCRSRTEACG